MKFPNLHIVWTVKKTLLSHIHFAETRDQVNYKKNIRRSITKKRRNFLEKYETSARFECKNEVKIGSDNKQINNLQHFPNYL